MDNLAKIIFFILVEATSKNNKDDDLVVNAPGHFSVLESLLLLRIWKEHYLLRVSS